MRVFSAILLFAMFSIGFVGCLNMDTTGVGSTKPTVTYHFDGGADMCNLFVLHATYTGADGRPKSEYIPSLPWSKSIEVRRPFEADLSVKFRALEQIPEKPIFSIGFDGAITTKKPGGGETPLVAKSRSEQDPKKLIIRVVMDNQSAVEDVKLRVAPLKFDKHFAFTPTIDDSYASAYSRVWSLINGQWIDDKEFLHMGRPRTSGYTPERVLSMGDGCGNERRFGFSCALWPTWGNQSNETFIKDLAQTSDNSIYISWEELAKMTDFGVSLLYHNVDERVWAKDQVAQIVQGFMVDNQKTYRKTGVKMKILGLPDGNKAYADAGQVSEQVVFTRNALKPGQRIYLHSCGDLYKAETYGGDNTSDITKKLSELTEQAASENPYWVGLTHHRPSEAFLKMLESIHDLYGKGGDDNIWVASWDEIYEYVALREGVEIVRSGENGVYTFEITLPEYVDFQFEELTFLLEGGAVSSIVPVSNSIVGFDCAERGADNLINMRFGGRWESLAQKYTLEYEAVATKEALADARYFVGMLSDNLAAKYESRISEVIPPSIDQVTLEGAKRYQEQYDGFVYQTNGTLKR